MQVCSGIVVDGDVEELVGGKILGKEGGKVGGRVKFYQVLFAVARVKETDYNIKVGSG